MYKRGPIVATAIFTILFGIIIHHNFSKLHEHLNSILSTSSSIPDNTSSPEMALSSVSRSVVKKVLAVETPEVWNPYSRESVRDNDVWTM